MVKVDQVKEGVRWAATMEMSGEEGLPEEGSRVGVSTLKEDESIAEDRESPRASLREENQLSLWALKSPKMIASPPSSNWSSGLISKRKLGGQEDAGGM